MNNVVTIREFTRNIYTHIKSEGQYVVTINGEKKIVVTIHAYNSNVDVVTSEKETPIVVTSKDDTFKELKDKFPKPIYDKYGCGCSKEKDKKTCSKHGRN